MNHTIITLLLHFKYSVYVVWIGLQQHKIFIKPSGLYINYRMISIFKKHRVLMPPEELKRREVRQSLAFFVHPDDAMVIECIDGSNKYPPITALDYLNQRFAVTY